MDDAPLILTLRFDTASFARFDRERRQHFPPERKLIPAHLTLFHHLPCGQYREICDVLAARAAEQPAFAMPVTSLRFLGQGTAYAIESPALTALRQDLARLWSGHLTRQDAQGFRPHVTIQNKVAAAEAEALHDAMSAAFVPFEVTAIGLLLWHYRGGPWEAAGEFAFAG